MGEIFTPDMKTAEAEKRERGISIELKHPLKIAIESLREINERWDGRGYPYGLKGEQISIMARLLKVADTFDSYMAHKSYRKKMTVEEAMEKIRNDSGYSFDPQIVKVFLEILEEEKIKSD